MKICHQEATFNFLILANLVKKMNFHVCSLNHYNIYFKWDYFDCLTNTLSVHYNITYTMQFHILQKQTMICYLSHYNLQSFCHLLFIYQYFLLSTSGYVLASSVFVCIFTLDVNSSTSTTVHLRSLFSSRLLITCLAMFTLQ